jgi:hypothetical protein
MKEHDASQRFHFTKDSPSGPLRCELERCPDGSVYLNGDEIEMIFEETLDALDKAVRFLEARGYVRQC